MKGENTMYVAVVYTASSGRPGGDLASFVASTKTKAIELAIAARHKWHETGFGPYGILVGKLGEEVSVPQSYELRRLAKAA